MSTRGEQDWTPDELEKHLQKYHAAIASEFEAETAAVNGTKELEAAIRDFYKKETTSAAAQIVWLANNASSESVRFAACRHVIAEGLAAARADGESPMEKLLRELHPQPGNLRPSLPR